MKPIMFLSKMLTKAETRYHAMELKVAGLVWACRQNRVQLQSCSKPIVVITDHAATRSIVNQTSLKTVDVNKMNGKLNLVPDVLSRLPTDDSIGDTIERTKETEAILDEIVDDFTYHTDGMICHTTEITIEPGFRQRIRDGYSNDIRLAKLKAILEKAAADKKDMRKWYRHILRDGLLYHVALDGRERLMIPSSCVQELLEITHDAKHHYGPKRMIHDLDGVAIQNLNRKARQYVQHCPTCQENRIDRSKPYGELQPINSPGIPFHIVTWDFIVKLPTISSKGSFWAIEGFSTFDAMMVITCKFSKKVILIPGNTKYKAHHWAELALRAFQLYD